MQSNVTATQIPHLTPNSTLLMNNCSRIVSTYPFTPCVFDLNKSLGTALDATWRYSRCWLFGGCEGHSSETKDFSSEFSDGLTRVRWLIPACESFTPNFTLLWEARSEASFHVVWRSVNCQLEKLTSRNARLDSDWSVSIRMAKGRWSCMIHALFYLFKRRERTKKRARQINKLSFIGHSLAAWHHYDQLSCE